jgi:uncharacterized protein
MELRGTVLNVVDFGAFVDVGLSDSGLIHISQLSAGYVRDPHDVVAVGDQVRAWVSSIDKDRRRVALTMIQPGTERPKPARPSRKRGRRQDGPHATTQPQSTQAPTQDRPPEGAARKPQTSRRRDQPRRGDRRGPPREQRTGAYEKRAAKTLVPITPAMEEGKEYMRSFGDLLQFHKKKKEHDDAPTKPNDQPMPPADGNGTPE